MEVVEYYVILDGRVCQQLSTHAPDDENFRRALLDAINEVIFFQRRKYPDPQQSGSRIEIRAHRREL